MGSVCGLAVGTAAVRIAYVSNGTRVEDSIDALGDDSLLHCKLTEKGPFDDIVVTGRDSDAVQSLLGSLNTVDSPTVRMVAESDAVLAYARSDDTLSTKRSVLVLDIGRRGTSAFGLDVAADTVQWTDRTSILGGDVLDSVVEQIVMAKDILPTPAGPEDVLEYADFFRELKELVTTTAGVRAAGAGPMLLTREEFSAAATPLIRDLLRWAAPEAPEAPEAILLTGGGAQIPILRTLVEEAWDVPVVIPPASSSVAAEGAALAPAPARTEPEGADILGGSELDPAGAEELDASAGAAVADGIETDSVEADDVVADEVEADDVVADEVEADEVETDVVEADEVETDVVEADVAEADVAEADSGAADQVVVEQPTESAVPDTSVDSASAGSVETADEKADAASADELPVAESPAGTEPARVRRSTPLSVESLTRPLAGAGSLVKSRLVGLRRRSDDGADASEVAAGSAEALRVVESPAEALRVVESPAEASGSLVAAPAETLDAAETDAAASGSVLETTVESVPTARRWSLGYVSRLAAFGVLAVSIVSALFVNFDNSPRPAIGPGEGAPVVVDSVPGGEQAVEADAVPPPAEIVYPISGPRVLSDEDLFDRIFTYSGDMYEPSFDAAGGGASR